MKRFAMLIMILFVLLLSACRNYVVDRPLNPGMTKEEVKQQWGDTGRKEFLIVEGEKVDFWYYNFGLSKHSWWP